MKKLFLFLFAALMSAGMFAVNANAKVKQRQAVVRDAMISSTQQQAPRAQQTEPLDVTIGSWYVEDWGDDGELYMYTADNSMGFYFDLIYGQGANDLIRDKEYTVADVYVSENTGEQYAGIFYDNEWHYGIKTLSLTKTIDANRHVHFAGSVLDSLDNAYTFHYDEGADPAPQVTTYTLQLVADSTKGSVAVTNLLGSDIIDNGNGNYTVPENAEVTILATPLEGYEFTGWKVGNRWCDFTECGTALNTLDNPMTITMTADVAYKAEFAAVTPQPVVNLKAIEFQVPASWENDTTYITAEDFPGFVATTYDIAKALSVPSDILIVFAFDFPGNDELSIFMKSGGEVIEESTTGNYARGAFFNIAESVHIYYPVLDEPAPEAQYAEIVWTEAVAKDALAEDATFAILGTEFSATIADAGNKMEIDANTCRFGTAEDYKSYTHRLKSGGASSSTKNYIMLNIPEAGTLRIAPRTGSNADTTRTLVLEQGGTELYRAVVRESQAIEVTEGDQQVKVYPYVEVPVVAGSVRVSYTAGMNFYSFGFAAESAPTTYTLQLVADSTKGSVAVTNLLGSDIIDNGNGNYTVPANAEVTILATPLEGYEFTGWKEGNIDEMVGCYYCGTALNTNDNPMTFTMTANVAYLAEFEAKTPQVERELTKLGFNFPSENIPADNDIEMAGTFEEGTMNMEKIIATGWFVSYDFVNAAEDETFKLRSKSNNDLVLCQFIPANDGEGGKWVQAIFTFGNYWSDDTWKGTPCKLIEEDLSDAAQYAWMEGMPEPLPVGIENIVLTEKAKKVIVDGMIYIIRDGKMFNLQGAQVR